MKIIQVINSIGNGGAEKLVVELSNEMAINNNVVICSFRKVEDRMIFPKNISSNVKLISFNKKKRFDINIYFKLLKLLISEKPDVVHFHLDATIKYVIPLTIFFPKISFVHTIHSNLHKDKKGIFNRLYKYKNIIKRIKFICISESILNDFVDNFPALKFSVIANGIKQIEQTKSINDTLNEINQYKINENTKVFISIGRIDIPKNYSLLIEVFNHLRNENIISLIIGDDPVHNKPLLKELKDKKTENVFFLGLKSNVSDYLSCSNALIMSSLFEGLPIVAIEALSMGLPIICTPAGGLVDVVEDGINGFISKDFSKEELIKQVSRFLSAAQTKLDEIRINNINKYKTHYDIQRCANKYFNEYVKK